MGTGIYGGFGRTHGLKAAVGSVSFMDENELFYKNIGKRLDIDPNGLFDVIAHGTPTSMRVDRKLGKKIDMVEVNARIMAKLIKSMPNYHGQDIRLLSCNTGANPNGFAQNLANKLNVNVYAPNNYYWAYPSGYHLAAAPLTSKEPDTTKLGKFIKFTPGGNRNG